jgi:hypothetical protein
MSEGEGSGEQDFAWIELEPKTLLRELDFAMFFVQVVSNSQVGHDLHNNPVRVLRERIPEMDLPEEDVRATVLRVNAERPANPRHRSELWLQFPGSTNLVGVQYKHPNEED